MGNSCTGNIQDKTHQIAITTSDEKESSNVKHLNVYITLTDEHGKSCEEIAIDEGHHHKMGDVDNFYYEFPELGKITEITIRRDDSGKNRDWYVELIVVHAKLVDTNTNQMSAVTSFFPVNRWICANKSLTLGEFDSVLPQLDKHHEQREQLLQAKRQDYVFKEKIIGAPPQVDYQPEDEKFSFDYKFSIVKSLISMKLKTTWLDLTNKEFQSLEDISKVYGKSLPVPKGVECWRKDKEFGNQKLAGCNPGLLELCTEIPSHVNLDREHLETLLEGKTVQEVLDQKKLYFIDLRYLADIECANGAKLPGPTCLLYVRNSGDVVPVAIQLMPEPADDNPVYYPTDPEYTWLAAKMWFNLADCSHHQSVTHLGFTHLLIESVAVASNRQLSTSHPIFRLLAPHFLYVIAINVLAFEELVQPGGYVDKTMLIGRTGMFNIIKERWAHWDVKEDGNLLKNLEKRGVADTEALPNYPYRDDAVPLWEAINRYVTTVVESVYDSPDKLTGDTEIHNWTKELSEVANFKGVPASLTSVEDLIEMLTVFIFISSVGHAAANFGQYDEYAFPPNYPSTLNCERPTTKDALTEDYVVKSLHNKEQAFNIMTITYVLSRLGTQSLGDFEIKYAWDPTSVAALKKLKEDLAEIKTATAARNAGRVRQYTILDPDYIPNAISI